MFGDKVDTIVKESHAVDLSISVVTYAPDLAILRRTVESLRRSVAKAAAQGLLNRVQLWLVDHGPGSAWYKPLSTLLQAEWIDQYQIVSSGGNDGYGTGHNRAVVYAKAPYHLILNPDVVLDEEAISQAIHYLNENPGVGLVTPKAFWPSGERQYLCKRYPTLWDLLLRGFAPCFIRRSCKRRLGHYELRGITEDQIVRGIPIASGCFMFLRRAAFDAAGGFSPQFFLYFEDFDLSLRLRQSGWEMAYLPSAVITHYGGRAAKKGWKHIWMFISSAILFFNLHGWRLY